jgi:putative hydroxymethylpyrimidine transport system permease protein
VILIRALIIFLSILLVWHLITVVTEAPPYILPNPKLVIKAFISNSDLLFFHGLITLIEILLGLTIGLIFGIISAIFLAYYQTARQWLMPILVVSQAIPVFALAPVLVLWLGYGMASKVAMATLIIYFPVTAAFFDGLRRTNIGFLDLALTMNASQWSILRHIRIPSAIPALASGFRVATAVAPIGAIVGEWVGSSEGLGYLMLHANGRMQIDVMFAALFTLSFIAIALYYTVDAFLTRAVSWSPETHFNIKKD